VTVTGVVAPPLVEPLVGDTLTHGTLAGASHAGPGVGVGLGVGVAVGVGVGLGVAVGVGVGVGGGGAAHWALISTADARDDARSVKSTACAGFGIVNVAVTGSNVPEVNAGMVTLALVALIRV